MNNVISAIVRFIPVVNLKVLCRLYSLHLFDSFQEVLDGDWRQCHHSPVCVCVCVCVYMCVCVCVCIRCWKNSLVKMGLPSTSYITVNTNKQGLIQHRSISPRPTPVQLACKHLVAMVIIL